MKKDAFYFPHFANARHDRKIKRMEKELGLESYAIYFKLLEILREQIDFRYPIDDLDLLADEIGTSEQKVRVVIANYQLFTIDEDNKFFSIKQIYYLQPYIEKTSRARLAAQKRWDKMGEDANAMQMHMQMHSKCNADAMQGKESKVKESKGKESKVKEGRVLVFVSPDWSELWAGWCEYKETEFRDKYKSEKSEQVAIDKLVEMSGQDLTKARQIVQQSIANRWKGLFEIKNIKNDTTKSNSDLYAQRRAEMYEIAAIIDRERGIRP